MGEDITVLLEAWSRGDESALDRLAPSVYPHLRSMAGAFLRGERPGHTWQATALVNELFLKLIAQREPRFEHRRHFYNACARLMRRALIDHARTAHAEKRGGRQAYVPLHEEISWCNAAGPEVLDLDRALKELAALDAEQVEMFETRFLVGCSAEETAELFGTSKATVDRRMRMARAFLYQRLAPGAAPDPTASG